MSDLSVMGPFLSGYFDFIFPISNEELRLQRNSTFQACVFPNFDFSTGMCDQIGKLRGSNVDSSVHGFSSKSRSLQYIKLGRMVSQQLIT